MNLKTLKNATRIFSTYTFNVDIYDLLQRPERDSKSDTHNQFMLKKNDETEDRNRQTDF